VVWRKAWEKSQDESLKAKLHRYNLEDCLALRGIVALLIRVAPAGVAGEPARPLTLDVVHTEDLQRQTGRQHRFGKKESALSQVLAPAVALGKLMEADYTLLRIFGYLLTAAQIAQP